MVMGHMLLQAVPALIFPMFTYITLELRLLEMFQNLDTVIYLPVIRQIILGIPMDRIVL